jgi:ABC-type branched-subunit amino acid transport system substrate-binding protein
VRRKTSTFAVLALAALLVAACSGAPRPQALSAGKGPNARAGAGAGLNGEEAAAIPGAGGDAAGVVGAPGTDAAGAAGAAGAGTGKGGKGAGGSGAGGTGSGGGAGGGGGNTPSNTPQPGDATLFSAAQNRRGITDSEITLCGHAALIFAQAFDTRPEDINVYWDWVNKHEGGIFGRKVKVSYEDDRYDGAAARDAANTCKSRNPFFIIGGIGFDQIPTVRTWAEDNKELYIHHIAVGAGGENLQYSFTMQPTVEETGRAFGEFISAKHHGQSIGIVYRNSDNWQPGRATAKDVLKAKGERVVAEASVEKNQSAYSAQIVTMQQADAGKGAQVVFIWENALGAAEFIKQSHNQGYHPTFVVFPFQTSLDVLGDDAMKSPIEGLGTWPAFKPGGYGGAFAEHGYDAEIKRFEDAFREMRGTVKPNDILWQVWLGYKQLHDMFKRCGQDCTRNRFAGLMLNGYKSLIEPNCVIDFTVGNHHRGANQFITLAAYKPGDTPYFKTTQWCTPHPG